MQGALTRNEAPTGSRSLVQPCQAPQLQVALSDRAELLVLVHDADRRLCSFEGEFEDWGVVPPTNRLVAERDPTRGGRIKLRDPGGGLSPHPRRTRRRIWYDPPQQLRVELLDGEALIRVAVRNGAQWWRWDHRGGVTRGRHDPTNSDTLPGLLDPTLLAPARLLSTLRFEQISKGVRLGRRVFLARASPREPMTEGQLAFEFEFDAEYGTILHRAIFNHGKCVQRTEALDVRFGIAFHPKRFVFETQ